MTIRDQVFLYCSLLYENTSDQVLSCLPQDRSEMLQKEAKRFDRFPKEVRLTLVSKLLGYMVQHVRNPHLERIHPSWIADALRMEHPRIGSAILSRFSPEYKKLVFRILGKQFQGEFPPLSATVMDTLFHVFLERFSAMGAMWGEAQLNIDTLYLLKEDELTTFLRDAGLREMASALSVAGRDALAALISRFPAEMQQDFLNAIRAAKGDSPEKRKLATARLSKYDLASMPMEEATLKIGLTKLGAVLKNRKETARMTAQRLPIKLGMILLLASKETETIPEEEAELMTVMQRLIEIEKIDKKYVDSLFSSAIKARPTSAPGLTGSDR